MIDRINPANRSRRRGFFVLDTLIGMIILGALAGALAVVLTRQNKAAARLAESRAAVSAAEGAIAALQSGAPVESSDPEIRVQIVPLDAADTPRGMMWVEARAECRGREARLAGLVPRSSGGVQ